MAKDDDLMQNPEMGVTDENVGGLNDAAHEPARASQGINGRPHAAPDKTTKKIEFILDIPLEITAELARTKMVISEMLKLRQGSIIEFSKIAGETLEILANQKLIARGEVVVVNEKYGIRLTEIVSPSERIESLK